MKPYLKQVVWIPVAIIVLAGCGRKSGNEQASTEGSSIGETVEASVNSLASIDDADPNATVATISSAPKSSVEKILEAAFLPKTAWAADLGCNRTLTAASSASGTKCTRNVNCAAGPFSWSGSVELEFTNVTSCLHPSIPNIGDSFTRTANFIRTARRGSIQTISTAHNNYLGEAISGGSRVTRDAGGLKIEILGVSKVLTRTGSSTAAVDVSVKTTDPVSVNHLARVGRVISGGSVSIFHNRAEYTAVHTYKDLTWSQADCAYPTSGSIDITLSGKLTGSASVVFNGCGSYTVTRDGEPTSDSMDGAE